MTKTVQPQTAQLQALGIALEIKHGLWGYYLHNPKFGAQSAETHTTVELCVAAAVAGEQPTPLWRPVEE